MNQEYIEVFKEEIKELLSELEISLLDLEKEPGNRELVAQIFRILHTIKGSSAMFGFDAISDFTHQLESVYALVRDDKITITKNLIDLTLECRDHIRLMLENKFANKNINKKQTKILLDKIQKFLPHLEKESDQPIENNAIKKYDRKTEKQITYRIYFSPHKDTFLMGINPILLLKELKSSGYCKMIIQLDNIPDLDKINPEHCYCH